MVINIELAKTIVRELQILQNSTLIGGTHLSAEELRRDYSNITDEQYQSLATGQPSLLCQGMALALMETLKLQGILTSYLFVYIEPIVIDRKVGLGFNGRYVHALLEKDYEKAKKLCQDIIIEYPDRCTVERYTHALLEVQLGNETFVIDPMAGLLYCVSKEQLLHSQGIYESYAFLNQQEFLKSSIQVNKRSLLLTTPLVWNKVYHISYDQQGGLPVIVPPNLGLYPNNYLII